MSAVKIVGVVLLIAGLLGLVYGGFSFTKKTHSAQIGPITLSVKEKESVNVPIWAGVAAVVAGGLMLLLGPRRK